MTFAHPARVRMTRVSPLGAASLSVLLLCGSLGIGIITGVRQLENGCGNPGEVHIFGVALTNLAINGLLASGYFTLGLTTVLAGPPILILTGYTIGQTVQAYGGQGIALLLPHGVLEVSTWAAAVFLGLVGLRVPVHLRAHPVTRAGPRGLSRVVTYVIVGTILAAVTELVWTSWYGPQLVCKN